MAGYWLLEGGAEFGGQMSAPDRRALELAGRPDAAVCIIPTAAAPDHNDLRAGQNGARWFRQLGAARVTAVPLVDAASANDPSIAADLRDARLIYLLGGFPHYLGRVLARSASWQAMVDAHARGAVVGGSSAGAMVLCEHYYDPETQRVQPGLGAIPHACVIPHHDRLGESWVGPLTDALPGALLIGIDEQTGMLDDAPGGAWTVYGKGAVTLYQGGEPSVYRAGERLVLSDGA